MNLSYRYDIKDDTAIENRLENKLVIGEASTAVVTPSKGDASGDTADTDSVVARQNRLNEKQAQGMYFVSLAQ